ncbi:MAG: hypothetical protein AAB262_09460, partial [Elusimicrobiota bacterium]
MNPLKTVMMAILAAFAVMSLLPASAIFANLPATMPAQTTGEDSSINILAQLIAKDKRAQADVSARVQRLLLAPDFKGRSYVTEDLLKDPSVKTIPALVDQWVEKHPGDAALLYYVARPLDGKVPQWVISHPQGKLIFKDDEKCAPLPERLGNYLAGMDQRNSAGSQVATVAVSGMVDSVGKFLLEASKGAGVILDPRVACAPKEARQGAERNDKPIDVPLGRRGGDLPDGTGSGFSFDDLYGPTGAVVAKISGPKDDGFRTLSIKLYTVPDGKGNFENKIGIVDITDPKFPYGPQLVALKHDETTFVLKSGGREYSLSVDANDQVVIKRPGGEGFSTSIETLARKRLDQVAGRGSVDIGGREYYVLGQGGVKGSLVFFSKAEGDARKLDTEAFAAAEV